ncbi:hypothetical protein U14_00707 [Candidatus Moduliflexus flocculans]|uniref:Uncharacterized protein n=1 Tax=Candidatus Moduliflexus flocculans TaxID=1499966 RepID=A0A0S6VQI3_9BACT|nr:hypothetical protein U14_00707 [Candidatus Moduliflexus flocculans]
MWNYWRLCIFFYVLLKCHTFAFCETPAVFQGDSELLEQARTLAEAAMQKAWKDGTEGEEQPVIKLVGKDGSIVLAQNTPRRLVPLPDGTLGMSATKTIVTIIPPSASRPVATTDVKKGAENPAEFRMGIIGPDQIQTMTILPQQLSSDQAEVIRNMTDTGLALVQQRFAIEQFRIQADTELAYLRIMRNFALWGVLVSIPFLLTIYWMAKNTAIGVHSWQKDLQEYHLRQQQAEHQFKLQELQSAERVIAASDEAERLQGGV